MSEKARPKGRESEVEEERLKRPEEEVKDLEPAPEKSDDVHGGMAKVELEYKPQN